jgi:hypothetical protein
MQQASELLAKDTSFERLLDGVMKKGSTLVIEPRGFRAAIAALSRAALIFAALSGAGHVDPARADEIQILSTFHNSRGLSPVVLVFAVLQEQGGERRAAIIVDHPLPATHGDSSNTPKRIVVLFDKQRWPAFEKMWHKSRACLGRMPNTGPGIGCPEETYADAEEGTCVSVFARTTFAETVIINLADKDGNHGGISFDAEDVRSLSGVSEVIRTVSDYLNR